MLFNCSSYCAIFISIAELIIPIGVASKEAKAEIETHLVIAVAQIGKCSM